MGRVLVVGVAAVSLRVRGADSLKAKRRVVRSILDRVKVRWNVAAAEVDHLEEHGRAGLGFACVANDPALVHEMLAAVIRQIESNPAVELTDASIEVH